MAEAQVQAVDAGIACLVLVARTLGVAADAASLDHRFRAPGSATGVADVLRAATALGLRAKRVVTKSSHLGRTPLPAIALDHDGGFVVLGRANGEKALLLDPNGAGPRELTLAELDERWGGELILLTRRAGLASAFRRFDLSWFLPAIVKYRRLLGEVLLASFFLQLFALISPLFFQVVVDKVLVHRGLTTLDVLVFALVVVSLFEVLLSGLRTYVFAHTANRIDVGLGAELYRHLLRLPIAYFEARRVGDTVARVRELETIRQFLTGSALTLTVDVFFTVVFLAVMWAYSPTLTAIVLATIPCYALLAVIVTPTLRARLHEKFNRGAESQAFLVESVNNVETIKASAVEPQQARRWEEQLAAYVSASFRATTLGAWAHQLADLVNKMAVAATLWFGARLVIEQELTVGMLVAFNMLAGRVSGPILRLVQLWQDFQQVGISVQRLGDVLNTPTEPAHSPGRVSLPTLLGRVTFDQVTFRYRADRPEVLKRLSIDVAAGEVVGIVGPSGSGKSTLTKLVQRLHVPESGRVLVDGVDLALVDPTWLRQHVGVVLQENVLFHRSVRENIALRDPALPLDRVIHAAKLAGAHEFILELPQGYDTLVGEHGANLSGGQRQRLAIARALITDPRILIFDEATSALDYESEAVIHQNMRYIAKGRTVFIIAHRLSAVRHANRIHVLGRGEIVETGTHVQLMERNGYYARLQQMQATGIPIGAGGGRS